jgi:hypothetical protein
MKTSIFILPLTIGASFLLITACNRGELAKSKQQNDSLMTLLDERESSINGFIASFNEVESSLDSVSAKQQIIHLTADKSHGEFKPGQKDRINAEIEAINNMMEQNRKTIAELNNKLKGSAKMNAHLEKTIETLRHQLILKFLELTTLNDELNLSNWQVAKLRVAVDTLTVQNGLQTQTISEKNSALHAAYYVVGKSKDLQDAKLIDKKGGLLGIGKTSKLSSDFDKSKFTCIDYNLTKNITINSKKIKIITSHPADSYTVNKDMKDYELITNLVITNPEKFWSVSKYLVIVNN